MWRLGPGSHKIGIIGVGAVGSACAFALLAGGLAGELVLVDVNRERAAGEAMDLAHGTPFVRPVKVYDGDWADLEGAGAVVFTAGVGQKPGETRLDLINRNLAVLKRALPTVVRAAPGAMLIMVTNPVDVLTFAALRISGLGPEKVIGSGTVLDSARFRQALSCRYGVEARNIHAYVLGEHGDSEVFPWSIANIAGVGLEEFARLSGLAQLSRGEIETEVRSAAYSVIARKGVTNYAVSLAVRRIIEAVLGDEQSILTVSGLLHGEYGLDGVCLSLPCILDHSGRHKALALALAPEEETALRDSARVLKSVIAESGLA
ncbi:MAG: L-lactate dehydrogenase [Peptococcaceae bacterium]|nr:L-lactate dehydrogenase [Peptococcaceae bacterium]